MDLSLATFDDITQELSRRQVCFMVVSERTENPSSLHKGRAAEIEKALQDLGHDVEIKPIQLQVGLGKPEGRSVQVFIQMLRVLTEAISDALPH